MGGCVGLWELTRDIGRSVMHTLSSPMAPEGAAVRLHCNRPEPKGNDMSIMS